MHGRVTILSPNESRLALYEKHRQGIESYLARSGEYQAYQMSDRRQRLPHHRQTPLGIKRKATAATMEWVRGYWQERAIELLDRRQTPKVEI